MRCLGCGEEMAVTAIEPDRALAGFEHHTFACAPCGATDHRLVLSRDQPPPAQPRPEAPSAATTSAATTPGAADDITEPPADSDCVSVSASAAEPAPATAWTRAVEKLRHRQSDLSLRAQEAKKTDWNSRFDRLWQRLAPDDPRGAQTNGARQKLRRRRSWSPQASARMVIPRRHAVEEPAFEYSPEQVQKFNEFWDSLLPRMLPLPACGASPLAPLPRSVSLVPIDSPQSTSEATRAILLLRGAYPARIAA
jgi:hypothetical protein